ncbi:MAG: hypothetical protein ACQKBW_08585 [Puniceicoccales bacterium]
MKLFAENRVDNLRACADEVVALLNAANDVSFELSDSSTSAEQVYHTYSGRRKRMIDHGKRLPIGIDETIQNLEKEQGDLITGYAEIDDTTICFWQNDSGVIVGCIVT